MTERTRGGEPTPGDVRPPLRPLQRPPGERYGGARRLVALPRPDLRRALVLGVAAAVVLGVAWGLLQAILDLHPGLIVVAVIGGWAVGTSVAWGAWQDVVHLPAPRLRALAAALAASSWLVGWSVAYLVSLAILPASELTFGERLAQQPFVDWLSPQLSILDVIELGLLAVVAWRSAR